MKFFRSVIFVSAFLFLSVTPLFAKQCLDSCENDSECAANEYCYIQAWPACSECRCYDNTPSEETDCTITTPDGRSCPGRKLKYCKNGKWVNLPCIADNSKCSATVPPPGEGGGGGGGSGGGGGGELSTNIDAQAQGFFAYQSFDKFLPNLLQIALILGAIAAFAFLIWGAIDYIISGGNQERVKTSKTMIGNALAGLAILAAAWVIWRLITYFLGLSSTIKGPFDIKLPTP